jgi:tetratricopeptide (TPR) repeat protein
MYTILIAVACGVVAGIASGAGLGVGWGIAIGSVVVTVAAALMTRVHVGKLKAVTQRAQAKIMEGQEEAQRLVARYQNRPVGTPKMMQEKVEKAVAEKVREALEITKDAEALYPWIPLGEKQLATLRFTLHYQIKEFEEADKYLDKILTLEPSVMAMKLVRMWKNDDPKLDKVFRKGVGRFKYEKGRSIWAAYVWILVKSDRMDDAVAILAEAKEKIEDEIFAKNWETAVNGNAKRITFAPLGQEWFALHLETPKQAKPGKGDMRKHPLGGRGGKRRFA